MRLPRLLAVILTLATPATADEITVFAASSLKPALDPIAADWQAATGDRVQIAYDGSAKLAQQIAAGAPADVFISAAPDWMDRLQAQGLIQTDTRQDIAGNALVLIAHDPGPQVGLGPQSDLAAQLGTGRLAMGMVASVPVGQYGHEALVALGMWAGLQDRLVETETARAALKLVATGEAPFGIVFLSDAKSEPAVTLRATFPASSHSPIRYPAALTAAARPAARAFAAALVGPQAQARLAEAGFQILPK